MNFLSTVLFSSFLWSIVGSPSPPEHPKQIEVAIDTTIEAIVVLFGLAEDESDRRFSSRVTPLMQKSIAHFAPFRFQETVNTPESGYGFDDPEMIHFFATHEFGHSFVNPLLDSPEHRDQVAALEHLMEPVRDEMSRVGYSRWDIVLKEHIVRLGEIRIALSMGADEEAALLRTHHLNERRFIYLPALEEAVVVYEEHRGEFPSLGDFLPTLLETLAEPGREEG